MKLILNSHSRHNRTAVAAGPAGGPTRIAVLSFLLVATFFLLPATANAVTKTSTGTGSWNTGGTWTPAGVPADGDDVVIAATHTVTVNVNTNDLASLTVNGTLVVGNNATNRIVTVIGDITVSGTFTSAGNGGNVLNAGGDITNNGVIDMNAGGADLDVTFNGAANQTLSGTGATNDFNRITVNNTGAADNDIVEVTSTNFTAAAGFLTLTNGQFKISGSFSFTNTFFNTSTYNIPAGTVLWLNNPNVTVTAQGNDAVVTGTLRITSGTFNQGLAAGDGLFYANGGTVLIEGGALNLASRFRGVVATNTVNFTISGGTMTVPTVANGSTQASFRIATAGSSFTMSGGTIVMPFANTGTGGDFQNIASTVNITGGTLQLGTATTPTATDNFTLGMGGSGTTVVPSLTIVDNATSVPTVTLETAVTVRGDVTINTGTSLLGTGQALTVAGNSAPGVDPGDWTNNGTFTPGTQTTTFNGTALQVIGGSSASAFNSLTINNSAGVRMDTSGSVSGVLTLTTDLTINDDLATPAVLTQSGTSAGNGDALGTVRRSDLGVTARAFGNPNVQITIGGGGTITTMDVTLNKGSAPGGFASAVLRVYSLEPGAGTVGSATVRLHYLNAELNSNVAANLTLWRATGSPSASWVDQGPAGITRVTAAEPANYIQKTGVTAFSAWTLASTPPAAPTAVELSRFNAMSYSDGVAVSWQSGYEVNNLGYHLYREQNGRRSRVTPAVVAGSALRIGAGSKLSAGFSYSWFDPQGTSDSGYYLEAIDLNGAREFAGPVYPLAGKGFSPKAQRAMLLKELNAAALESSNASQTFERSWSANTQPATIRKQPRLRPESISTQHEIAAGPAVKVRVRRPGWYRLTRAELIAAGLDTSRDARLLQMYVDGEEIPIRITGDGVHLNASDSVEFYGVALDIPSTDTRTYWLVSGDRVGKRVATKRLKRMPSDEEWTNASSVRSFVFTTEIKEKIDYYPALLNGDDENIFGQFITTEPVVQTMTVRNADQYSGQVELKIGLQGASRIDHVVDVQFNGVGLGTVNFSGLSHKVTTFTVERSLLRDGDNTLQLTSANGDSDVSFVDWIRVTYPHLYRADDNKLQFSVQGGQTVRITGFTTQNIRVVDITDPNNTSELDVTAGPSGSGYGVKLQPHHFGTRTLLAFADNLAEQASMVANQPSSWNAAANGADMLIITHPDFRQAIEPLAALRRSQGLNVAVVDVEDVYDEFGFGVRGPMALKTFLSWAASRWSRAPQYLLLVGDSSWDPRNYMGQGANDFVPTKMIDTAAIDTASDDWLADFNGDDLAEMAVGRLPGRTAAEISLMAAKIMAFERDLDQGAPARGALLVADTDFESQSSQTGALLPSNMAVQSINRSAGGDDITRTEIVNAINRGPLLVNYYGHGSVQVWTGEGLLDSTLAENLTNSERLSLFVMMTCLNGYAHDAYIDSLSESVLKAQNGGAVAVWASSGFTEPGPQLALDLEFYRQLFGSTPLRLGLATRNAKASISDPDVRRTWVLLGDPAMRIR